MPDATRREFLKSTSAVASAFTIGSALSAAAYAGSDETLKIGLVGCGGRGTGAAAQALKADPGTKLIAMADTFMDKVEGSYKVLQKNTNADQLAVDQEHMFDGLDGYKRVIESGVDVVLLATPPYFRPQHLKECIEADKHVFVEKPVAVDAPGVRSILNSCAIASRKGLSVVSGLCWRYETGMNELVNKIHDGIIGSIRHQESVRYLGNVGYYRGKEESWTDLEYYLRNWYYQNWLSADFVAEQFVHELDKQSWVRGSYPVSCIATGGRETRTDEKYGNVFDHFSAIYEYSDGTTFHATTRQQPGCSNLFYDKVYGEKGTADLMRFLVRGETDWHRRERRTNMHQLEHDAMYAALRKGEHINNGDYMANSTMMGLIARMSAYTGRKLTWEEAMNSQQTLGPQNLSMDMEVEVPPVAVPGVTPFS